MRKETRMSRGFGFAAQGRKLCSAQMQMNFFQFRP